MAVVALAGFGSMIGLDSVAHAQDPFNPPPPQPPVAVSPTTPPMQTAGAIQPVDSLEALARLLKQSGPTEAVHIPADAIVVPYDPEANPDALPSTAGTAVKEQLLVPYELYQRLWNAANPDQSKKSVPPPTSYAWADARYSADLTTADSLQVRGKLTLELFVDDEVAIPFSMDNCVLESLTVDGVAGRLQLATVIPQAISKESRGQAAQAVQSNIAPAPHLMLLRVSGKGRKSVDIQLRMKLERRGGWNVVEARVPAAPATAVRLTVPQAHTEVRLSGVLDRALHETTSNDEVVETALPLDGRAAWSWRRKVAQANTDQGLTVDARAIFDIQEDGQRMVWNGAFEFRRGRRDSFTLLVPKTYVIERVTGSNIRGWSAQTVDDKQQLTVDLLATVADREKFSIQLFRAAGTADMAASDMPVIEVPDAMLQRGQILVRRSGMLELRTSDVEGLSRIDLPDTAQWQISSESMSPLPLLPFQAYQYSQVPFRFTFDYEAVRAKFDVDVQSLLKIAQLESTLESRLVINTTEGQLYHLQFTVPANWRLERPEISTPFEWATQTVDDRQTVDIYFANGLKGSTSLVMRGKYGNALSAPDQTGMVALVPVPRIEFTDAQRQRGDVAVVSDPAFNVTAEQLKNCESVLLGAADSWLAAQYKPLARVLIQYSATDYDGQLRVTARTPQVTAFSLTNVKLTDRAIEETIYCEFTIRSAGIRQLAIELPMTMKGAKVTGPLIRTTAWSDVQGAESPRLRLSVELQEEVMGQYSLVIENDRIWPLDHKLPRCHALKRDKPKPGS